MAEFVKIKPKGLFAENKREIILIAVLGFGSLFYSVGALFLYIETPKTELKITLTQRPLTAPRESAARLAQRGAAGTVAGSRVTPPVRTASAAGDSPTTSGIGTLTSETKPVLAAAVAPPVEPVSPSHDRIRTIRTRIGGEWVEVQDFTQGVVYKGEVHDFSRGEVPVSIRNRERRRQ